MSAALAAHYAQDATTIATLWKVTRRDEEVFGFTDHDQPIPYSGLTYEPSSAYDPTAVKTTDQLNVDDVELHGLLDSVGIAADDMEAGIWDGADVEIVEVNYNDLSMGENVLRVGKLGQVQRLGDGYVAELRGLMQYLQNNIGRLITDQCDADLGDTRCGVNLAALTAAATVTSVTSTRAFTASSLAQAADYFKFGKVTFTSGANDGIEMEVKLHATGGVLTLVLPMPFVVLIGDTFTISPGCNKLLKTADAEYLGDCKVKFDNVINFRGFAEVPGVKETAKLGGQ